MATGTKSGTPTTIKVGAVIGAVVLFAVSPIGRGMIDRVRSETQDRVIFSFTWEPNYRESGVHVVGVAEGVEFHNDIHPRPVSIATWIPKGARAIGSANQTIAGKLSCVAQLNGVFVDERTINTVGQVDCRVNFPKPDVR